MDQVDGMIVVLVVTYAGPRLRGARARVEG
jgi:hypothetical protein